MTLWVTVLFFLETWEGKMFSLNVLLKTFWQWSWCSRWQCFTFSRLGKAKMLEEDALLRLCFRHWVGKLILMLLYLMLMKFVVFCCNHFLLLLWLLFMPLPSLGLISSVLHWYGVWTLLDSFFLPTQVGLNLCFLSNLQSRTFSRDYCSKWCFVPKSICS